jgi:hypothetical protein
MQEWRISLIWKFVGLPHKVCPFIHTLILRQFWGIYTRPTFLVQIYAPERFEEAICRLQLCFTDNTKPSFLFQHVYHKRIPADGVENHMHKI